VEDSVKRVGFADIVGEPFRVFFPLGTLWSLAGVFFWVLKGWWPALDEVSSKVHVWTQVYGFMTCFVVGFLTTAIPSFTDTAKLRAGEVLLLVAFSTTSVISVFCQQFKLAHVAFILTMLMLVLCLVPRFIKRKSAPPITFVFVPFALVSALLGSGLLVAVSSGFHWRMIETITLASNLLFQGFITFLILGVGGFLVRSILGWLALHTVPNQSRPDFERSASRTMWIHSAAALILFGSFFVEAYWSRAWGAGIRALIVTLEVVWQMRIHRSPNSGKMGAQWLRVALAFLLVGLWGDAVISPQHPLYRLAILHLCFVGGFSMTTLAIASRVVLSHGGFSQIIRRHYKPLSIAQGLVLLGLLTRFSADFIEQSYTRHLQYAAALWCLGVLVWCAFVLVKVSRRPAE